MITTISIDRLKRAEAALGPELVPSASEAQFADVTLSERERGLLDAVLVLIDALEDENAIPALRIAYAKGCVKRSVGVNL